MEEKEIKAEDKEESIIKITITRDAEIAVAEVVRRINSGFESGRVNRQDVASFLLLRSCKDFSDADMDLIRNQFTNNATLLEAALKRYKETGYISEALREALLGQIGLSIASKKSKKSLRGNCINDTSNEGIV